jgi:hypothetical protein
VCQVCLSARSDDHHQLEREEPEMPFSSQGIGLLEHCTSVPQGLSALKGEGASMALENYLFSDSAFSSDFFDRLGANSSL